MTSKPSSQQPSTAGPPANDPQNDPQLWDLMGKASSVKADPLFSRNVLRQIRKTNSPPDRYHARLWQVIFRPRFLIIGGTACLLLTTWSILNFSKNDSITSAEEASASILAESTIEQALDSQLLIAAAENPDLFSDEDLVAMLF